MVRITGVEKGSVAEKLGILPGDLLFKIGDEEINDVLDYRFFMTAEKFSLLLSRDGEEYSIQLLYAYGEEALTVTVTPKS